MGTLADYMRDGHATVPGWFEPGDQRVFAAASEAQRSAGIGGDLLEIGAYKGRSAILLGYLVGEGEQLVVCDLFDGSATNEHSAQENADTYVGLTAADFRNTYRRFHPVLPTIIAGPSAGLVDYCEPQSYRFMHVDGSHMYPDVVADLLLAKELAIGPDALVAIDDIRSAHTPGVWAATWECVYRHGLVPFAVSSQKMYATWGTPTRSFADAFTERIIRCAGLEVLDAPISGGTVLRIVERHPTPSRLGQIALDWFPPTLRRRFL